jgi:hypothetical protein
LGPIRLRDLNDGRNPGARGLSVFERGANAVTGHNGSAEGESGLKNPFGRSVSGLAPPALEGHRPLSEYRLPSSIAGRRSAYLLAHAALIAAGLASSALAFGWVPFLAGISAVAADLYWTFKVFGYGDDGAYAFQSNMFGDAKKNYQAYVEAVYRALLSRMDIDPASAPRLSINNRFGDRFGGAIDADGSSDRFVISVGEGFAELPAEQLAAVLAHELGHWYFKDSGAARLLRSRAGWEFGMETIKKILVYGLLLHAAGVFGVPASLAVIVSAAGVAFTAGAAPGVSAALMHWRQKLSEPYPEDWPSAATIAAGALILAAAGSHFIHLGIGFDVPAALIDPAFIAVSAGWAALSATLTAVGLYFGVAVQRQEEFRADHFGGWASDRRWLADYLRTASSADAGGMRHSVYERVLNRFLHSHPEAKRRIAQLD